jgi:hypothetical protein
VDFLERTRNGYDAAAAMTAPLESVGLPVYSTAESTPQAFLIARKRLVR